MSSSDATASPAFEEIRRTAALAALARDELAPGSAHDGAPYDLPVIWQLATADISGSIDSSADDPATRLANLITAAGQLGTACRGGGVDSSTDVSDTRLVNRIIAATRHDDIIKVLPWVPGVWTARLTIQLRDWLAGSSLPRNTRRSLPSCL